MAQPAIKMSGTFKLATARRVVNSKLPYFARITMALAPKEAPGLGTFGVTDNMIMLYDPEMLEEWELKKVAFVNAHEVMHIWHKHSLRAERLGIPRDMRHPLAVIYNIAGDAYINAILREVFRGWAPDDAVLPDRLPYPFGPLGAEDVPPGSPPHLNLQLDPKWTTEEAYAFLKRHLPQCPRGSVGGEGQSGTGDQQGKGSGSDKKDKTGGKQPCCGSGAGHQQKDEPDKDDPAGRSQVEVAQAVKQAAQAIKAAAEKRRGSVPGGLLADALQIIEPPRVPWEQQLARVARTSVEWAKGRDEIHFGGVSRRQAALGFGEGVPILPVLRSPQVRAWFAIDTSGSMDQSEMAKGVREVKGVIDACGGKVTYIAMDATVQLVEEVTDWRAVARGLKGRGGTDFRPLFKKFEETPKKLRPNLIVITTDCEGPAPRHPPIGCSVVWLRTTNSMPHFGEYGGDCGEPWGTFIDVID